MKETPMGKKLTSKLLTHKQRQVLTFLTRVQQEGRWPTLEEIARCIGARSPAAAHHHLKRLEIKGHLRRTAWGTYELTPQVQMLEGLGVARVPVRGTIAAGTGVEAVEAVEDWLTVDSVFARHPRRLRAARAGRQHGGCLRLRRRPRPHSPPARCGERRDGGGTARRWHRHAEAPPPRRRGRCSLYPPTRITPRSPAPTSPFSAKWSA